MNFNIFNITDFSLAIALTGAALLYFGKIIADTKVGKYDKLSYYIEGLLFSIPYLLLPAVFSFYVIKNLFKIPTWWAISIQVISLMCLSLTVTAHNLFRKYGLVETFKKGIREEFRKLSRKSTMKWITKGNNWLKSKLGMDCVGLNLLAFYTIPTKYLGSKISLFILSFITILSLVSIYSNETTLLLLSFSSVLTFLSLSLIALAYGFSNAYYPPVKLYLDNGKVIEGNVLKFGEFIYLINSDKQIFVNSSKVLKIEKSLWKNKKVV